jgi:hypothetical protein
VAVAQLRSLPAAGWNGADRPSAHRRQSLHRADRSHAGNDRTARSPTKLDGPWVCRADLCGAHRSAAHDAGSLSGLARGARRWLCVAHVWRPRGLMLRSRSDVCRARLFQLPAVNTASD